MAALPVVPQNAPAPESKVLPKGDTGNDAEWKEWVNYNVGPLTPEWTRARGLYKWLTSQIHSVTKEKKGDVTIFVISWPTEDCKGLHYSIGLGAPMQEQGRNGRAIRFTYRDYTFWETKDATLSDDDPYGKKVGPRELKQSAGKVEASVTAKTKSSCEWARGKDVEWKWIDLEFYDTRGKDVGSLRQPLL